MFEIEVEMDFNDSVRINRLINGLSAGMSGAGLTTLLSQEVQPYLHHRAWQRFMTQGDDASGRWAPLTETTQKFRRFYAKRDGLKIQPDFPINERTTQLRDYVTQSFDILKTEQSARLAIPSTKTSGYGRFISRKLRHAQLGGIGLNGDRFPARPVAVISGKDKQVIDAMTIGWANDLIRSLQ